ncbi:uncharacterized protein OCT59_007364 [Rhizophagus irregularis]|uniref:Uncharacterized protein n=3 Tax=Rhizophagus irregularis TaxID=588596 RepID=A0A2I1E384_9GLOM|nr:hypothetical protein RhiirB3_429063 [Rhizophagus irregularis]UZO15958.1 hypothetical protein OCT59_007364 [Rhizophagus irregularis]CAB4478138.1 unnamed protein product [Rhizophagus irregularis]CAB5180086.1 unnamed protein product [Rhizophagus irregularis]CAB5324834.1 unnamed protein product [Rhizophagus irregularis]
MKSFIWLYIIFIYFINYTYSENITITVGERGLYFSPQNITAKYNDAIKWVFLNGRHQVVQSDGPAGSCVKSSDINAFSSILKEGGEFSYIITQKSGTIYYFCSFSSHCAYGMWGTINIDPNPTSNSSPQTTYNPEPTPTSPDSENNLPIIIGSSIGGFFALAISGLIIFMLYRRNKYQKQFEIAMQPYDPKLNVGDGNDRISNSDGNIGIPATSASSVNLSRTNTNTYDDHSNNEVIMSNISPNMASIAPSIVSNIVPNTQLNEETMRGYDDRASSVYRGRDSLYQYNASDGERSERSKSPPTYNPTLNTNYNPYDNEKSYLRQQQQQQPPFPQQSLQQPPIPPRPNNFPPSQQQFGAPYLPPRPLAVNRFPPQYGPSSSPPPLQEFQYNASSDPFGPANPGQHYQHRQSNLPRPPPPPPSQPPPSLPLPPPPNQQQTGHYIIDPSQYYGPNNSDN